MWIIWTIAATLLLIAIYDLTQKRHAILRNFPLIGHFRYLLEMIGPELRQYIVTDNNSERPFDRDQRTWVYSSAKKQNNYFGFGTDNEVETASNYTIIKQSAFPIAEPQPGEPDYDSNYSIPCAKVIGAWRGRRFAFRPKSIVNISAMSFGSLSAAATVAINKGCALSNCLHNTGEGGISDHHSHGGDLIWQIGTGYFGCRTKDGNFSLDRLADNVAAHPHVRAIEIKLSQGAKPGLGGVLPAAKITPEIARIRQIERGRDCLSPSSHRAFRDVDSLLETIESIADRTGRPVGIKSAVGDMKFWTELVTRIEATGRAPDYIQIDGGEGGTGAAPLTFSDHVALPFKVGFARVFRVFAEAGLDQKMVFIGSGKLGFPESALFAFSLGCDMVAVAREPMLAIGCIQAQRCQTGHCPTGVATQNRWLAHGLDPTLKSARLANYIFMLRKEILRLTHACGFHHPALVGSEQLEILDGRFGADTVTRVFGYQPGWGLPDEHTREAIERLMLTTPLGESSP